MQEFLTICSKEKQKVLKDPGLDAPVKRHLVDPLVNYSRITKQEGQQNHLQFSSIRKGNQEERFRKTNLTTALIEAEIIKTLLPEYPLVNLLQGQE